VQKADNEEKVLYEYKIFWTRNVGQCPTWWSPCRT